MSKVQCVCEFEQCNSWCVLVLHANPYLCVAIIVQSRSIAEYSNGEGRGWRARLGVCVCMPAVVLTQRVSTAHFCKSISDQSLLVLETLVLLHLLCMDQWVGKGGIVSTGGEGRR